MTDYCKSKTGVYPLEHGWGYSVVAPGGTRVTQAGFPDAASARKAARHQARFYDRLERDRVDGVVSVRTDNVLERGMRACRNCGKPHDLVALTRRGKRSGQTWATPDCGEYCAEPWETLSRRLAVEFAGLRDALQWIARPSRVGEGCMDERTWRELAQGTARRALKPEYVADGSWSWDDDGPIYPGQPGTPTPGSMAEAIASEETR